MTNTFDSWVGRPLSEIREELIGTGHSLTVNIFGLYVKIGKVNVFATHRDGKITWVGSGYTDEEMDKLEGSLQ